MASMSEATGSTDDDDELEIVPVDPEVLAAERARRIRSIEDVTPSRKPADPTSTVDGYDVDWRQLRDVSFRPVYILGFVGLSAISQSLVQIFGPGIGVFALTMVALAAGWWWVMGRERRLNQARERRMQEMRDKGFGAVFAEHEAGKVDARELVTVRPLDEFSFDYEPREWAIAAGAAVAILFVLFLFGPPLAAIAVGLVAAIGVTAYFKGRNPDPLVVLGWFMLLAIYLATSNVIVAYMLSSGGAGQRADHWPVQIEAIGHA